MPVRVVTAAEAAELDRRAIASGTPSRVLMQAAGAATARAILERRGDAAGDGVAVYAGPGNNGGDAWIAAAALARAGLTVRVAATGEPRSPDAAAARSDALTVVAPGEPTGAERVVLDGLLGTGASGAPRGEIAAAIARIAERHAGATVVAVDVPSGLDATTGATPGAFVRAHLTVTYGSMKRGLLVNRDAAGAIVVADIGLGAVSGAWEALPTLVDAAMVRAMLPGIPASAHKGVRKRLAIVGGAPGMAGAAVLAARAAMRAGIGMTKLCLAPGSVEAAQAAEPASMTTPWPVTDADARALAEWAQALLIGPGLGRTNDARALIERLLAAFRGPVVLDADALNVFEGARPALAALLRGRAAVITPHEVEFSRLSGMPLADVVAQRFEACGALARELGCTVLLKGVPTVVSDGAGSDVSAAGTPVLATAGSGDVLGGIVATLLAQTGQARASAAAGAWVHGRAAELAGGGQVRGVTLGDVVASVRDVWRFDDAPGGPWLAELAEAGERY